MNKEQRKYYLIKSPNLIYVESETSFIVKNTYNKNSVSFENNSIRNLLDFFSEPKAIDDALNNMSGDNKENSIVIKKLIEWDFLIVDLGLQKRNCPLCSSISNSLLVVHPNKYYQQSFDYVKCDKCDFVYLNPTPSEQALNFFYSFKNYYSIIPLNSNNKFEKKLQIKSNELRTNLLDKYFQINSETKVLDVGSGTGVFGVYLSQRYKCKVTCIDKDNLALLNTSHQVKAINADFKNVDLSSKFDIITMWGFIEHESDPIKTLEKAYELLNPKGIIIIDAPNINGKLAKKSLINWPYLHSPYHLCHYEPKTIQKLIKLTGFNMVDLKFQKTGTYLLKYSDNLLQFIYKHNLFYSNNFIDYIVYLISRIFIKFEKQNDNRLIIIAKKDTNE